MKKKNHYSKKLLEKKPSGSELVYKRRRLYCIFVWLILSVIIGIYVYTNYATSNMSDTPVHSINLDGGVQTGTELKENVPFGPWMADN